ncbi:MAG: hypothetical protein QNJ41_02180 [Xenococcaceae cyanobacterium MO_188.B32]|nr:hypothetical protein [Xenococcaceae cyanobacterium MO_188.B32]
MNEKEQLIREIEQAPDYLIKEVLDFLLFIKSRTKYLKSNSDRDLETQLQAMAEDREIQTEISVSDREFLEETNLLQEKLAPESNWEETLERIEARRKEIHARTGGKPFKPSVTEIIHQMREERDEQLMQACFPNERSRPSQMHQEQ